jgi:hypothetical protein
MRADALIFMSEVAHESLDRRRQRLACRRQDGNDQREWQSTRIRAFIIRDNSCRFVGKTDLV